MLSRFSNIYVIIPTYPKTRILNNSFYTSDLPREGGEGVIELEIKFIPKVLEKMCLDAHYFF